VEYLGQPELEDWLRANQPGNTKTAYRTYAKQYIAFARKCGVVAVPGTPNTVANFLKHLLVVQGLSSKTINRVALSAVGDLHRFRDENPHQHSLVKAMKKVVKAKGTKSTVKKVPIRAAILQDLLGALNLRDPQELMQAFILVVSYKAFLRSSECVGLEEGDLWLESVMVNGVETVVLFLFIQKSKTDQERTGHTIVLGPDHANPWKCPVRYFKAVAKRRASGSTHFFYNKESKAGLPPKRVNQILKRTCKLAGYNPDLYSSHGLRAGGATEAAAAGVRTRLIKKHGNWRSSAVYIYIHEDMASRLKVSLAI
jgi:site-specific recombinase XerD